MITSLAYKLYNVCYSYESVFMNEVIELNNLTKKYSVQQSNAVDHVSFDVKEGEFFTLLGPNGAGKTTIISILTTTLSKTSGDIKIFGLDLEKTPPISAVNSESSFKNQV